MTMLLFCDNSFTSLETDQTLEEPEAESLDFATYGPDEHMQVLVSKGAILHSPGSTYLGNASQVLKLSSFNFEEGSMRCTSD
jgi:hypothetical protein